MACQAASYRNLGVVRVTLSFLSVRRGEPQQLLRVFGCPIRQADALLLEKQVGNGNQSSKEKCGRPEEMAGQCGGEFGWLQRGLQLQRKNKVPNRCCLLSFRTTSSNELLPKRSGLLMIQNLQAEFLLVTSHLQPTGSLVFSHSRNAPAQQNQLNFQSCHWKTRRILKGHVLVSL